MNRSTINRYIEEAISFFNKFYYKLPQWAYFTTEEWKQKGNEYAEVRESKLGWDITDFGSGHFEKTGLLLFTLRNGTYSEKGNTKPYTEKIMLVRDKQVTPAHFHRNKISDVINRGGGKLCIQLWQTSPYEIISGESFTVQLDGVTYAMQPGDIIRLKPGESLCLQPRTCHKIWTENGMTIMGEIATVTDDKNDDCFLEPTGVFSVITEDEPILYCLCSEYPNFQE